MDAITYAMCKKYTDKKVDQSAGLHREIVNSLPSTGDNNTIYMVLDPNATGSDIYDEWLWTNGAYEHIGSTRVDLTDYYNKTQVDAALSGKANAATSIAGYGITDAYTKSETDEIFVKPYKAGDSIEIEYGMPLYGFSYSSANPVIRAFLPLPKPIVASNVNVILGQANMQLITPTGYESKSYSLLTITSYIKPNGLMLYIKGFDYSTEDRPVIVKLYGTITFS